MHRTKLVNEEGKKVQINQSCLAFHEYLSETALEILGPSSNHILGFCEGAL